MKGKMFINKRFPDHEYIVLEELDNIVALMHTTSQEIVWETRNTLSRKYTLKGK